MKKEFVSQVNNENKINPPVYLSVNAIDIDGKAILHIYVPESSQVHICSNSIFDRNEDGDFEITNNTNLVAELYDRKQRTYSENKIYPMIQVEDLREEDIFKIIIPITPQVNERGMRIIEFCKEPKSRAEIQNMLELKDKNHFMKNILQPLIELGLIKLTLPDKPRSPKQKYFS